MMLKKAGVAADDEAVKFEMVRRAFGVVVPIPTDIVVPFVMVKATLLEKSVEEAILKDLLVEL